MSTTGYWTSQMLMNAMKKIHEVVPFVFAFGVHESFFSFS